MAKLGETGMILVLGGQKRVSGKSSRWFLATNSLAIPNSKGLRVGEGGEGPGHGALKVN